MKSLEQQLSDLSEKNSELLKENGELKTNLMDMNNKYAELLHSRKEKQSRQKSNSTERRKVSIPQEELIQKSKIKEKLKKLKLDRLVNLSYEVL